MEQAFFYVLLPNFKITNPLHGAWVNELLKNHGPLVPVSFAKTTPSSLYHLHGRCE